MSKLTNFFQDLSSNRISKTLSRKASCSRRIVGQALAETKQKVSQFNNKCLPTIYIDQRPKKRPTTHQTYLKHPMYCHTPLLYYPTCRAYIPNSSLEQKNTGSSNHGRIWGRPSPIFASTYKQQSCKNPLNPQFAKVYNRERIR